MTGVQTCALPIFADLAGLACAVQAGKNDGADLKDLFENYARSWMEKQRPEAIKTEVQTDVHAPQPTRVNIPVQCQDEFYDAFGVKKTDGKILFLPSLTIEP